ncbi:MAG TPA: enoyl-CoA hydratase/isomerase family protein [Solirubrobacterales bacterium]|nr:enoyl-CoA hydratase/isomerase family protein [Solirubrobacterales bacterium]
MVENRREGVVRLTIDRPDRLNALSGELLDRLGARLAELGDDDAVRVLVLAGAGRAFSVGADVADFEAVVDEAGRRAYLGAALAVYDSLADWPKPTIAAVDGLALGGGCELALACDLVVAGPTAEFALPELRLGVVPSFALTRGRERLSRGALALLTFSGRRIDARQARELGLVDVIAAASAEAEAESLAAEIAANPGFALRVAKRLLRSRQGLDAAVEASVECLGSEDHRQALAGFRRR